MPSTSKSTAGSKRRRRRRRPRRLTWSPRALREAVDEPAELLADLAREILERGASGIPAPRRPAGRGSQLSPALQLAVMVGGAVLGHGTRTMATMYGLNRKSVQRVLSSATYAKFRDQVMQDAIAELSDLW